MLYPKTRYVISRQSSFAVLMNEGRPLLSSCTLCAQWDTPVNVKIVIFNFAFCSLLIVVQIRNIMYGDGTEEDQVTGTYNYNNATTLFFNCGTQYCFCRIGDTHKFWETKMERYFWGEGKTTSWPRYSSIILVPAPHGVMIGHRLNCRASSHHILMYFFF